MVGASGADGGTEIIREIREVVIGEAYEFVDTLFFEGDEAICESMTTSGESFKATSKTIYTEA